MPDLWIGVVFDIAAVPIPPDPDDGIITEYDIVLVTEEDDVIEHADWVPAPLVVTGAPLLTSTGQGPVVSGTGEPLATITVLVDAAVWQIAAIGDGGTWTLDLSGVGPGTRPLRFEQLAPFGLTAAVEATLVVTA